MSDARSPATVAGIMLLAVLLSGACTGCQPGREASPRGAQTPAPDKPDDGSPGAFAADADATITVKFIVRDGPSRAVIPPDRWAARIEPLKGAPPGPIVISGPPYPVRPLDGERGIAGPAPEGFYRVTVESAGYIRLTRVLKFVRGLDHRLDVSLDPAPRPGGATDKPGKGR